MLKIKNKILYIAIAILLTALAINIIRTNIRGERSFSKSLYSFIPTEIDKLEIVNNNIPMIFTKDEGNWRVSQNNNIYKADSHTVENIINELAEMNIQRLVSKDKAKFHENEIDDTTGTRVTLYKKNKTLADLYVGRFSYRQTGQGGIQLSTMVRRADQTDVYSIEGALSMSVKRDLNNFRDKTIINTTSGNIKNIEFTYPGDSSFTLTNKNDIWYINNDTAETGKVQNYLNEIKNLKAGDFTNTDNGKTTYTMTATLDGGKLITVKASKQGDRYNFVSSQNESTLTDQEHTFKRLFISKTKLIKTATR